MRIHAQRTTSVHRRTGTYQHNTVFNINERPAFTDVLEQINIKLYFNIWYFNNILFYWHCVTPIPYNKEMYCEILSPNVPQTS